MNDPIENLKKVAEEYRKNLYEVQDKLRLLVDVPRAKALLGKCFKYLNSYDANTKWWYYSKVIKIEDDSLIIDSFQEAADGKIEFVYNQSAYLNHFSSSYIPISEEEYFKERKKLLNKMMKRHKKERGK
jgi:hypothetical protein